MSSYYIRKISQVDNTTLMIDWNDGISCQYKLSYLQKNCPCAGCNDENKNPSSLNIPEDRRAKKIISVGNYAIRIFFDGGCQHGIYTFDYLRNLK